MRSAVAVIHSRQPKVNIDVSKEGTVRMDYRGTRLELHVH
jgi:hypothetical protein